MNKCFSKIIFYILSILVISVIINSCASIPPPAAKKWKYDTIDVGRCGFNTKVINGERIILSVKESSPAQKADIRKGDIFISGDGKKGYKDYIKLLNNMKKGDKILLTRMAT